MRPGFYSEVTYIRDDTGTEDQTTLTNSTYLQGNMLYLCLIGHIVHSAFHLQRTTCAEDGLKKGDDLERKKLKYGKRVGFDWDGHSK